MPGNLRRAPLSILDLFGRHIQCVRHTAPRRFNDDQFYKSVVVGSMELKRLLADIASAFAQCCAHVSCPPRERARLLRHLIGGVKAVGLIDGDNGSNERGLPAAATIDGEVQHVLDAARRRAGAVVTTAQFSRRPRNLPLRESLIVVIVARREIVVSVRPPCC